jgi:drug/metabolite transporter (DMT)-like permease
MSELGPAATAFYRLLFSLPVVYVWMEMERRTDPSTRGPANRSDYGMLALAGCFFAGDLAVWHWSIRLTSVANATLLANFAPIFVSLGAYVLFGSQYSKAFIAGMVIAIAGVCMLLGDSLAYNHGHLLGDVFGITTALFYAGYLLTVSRLRSRFSTAIIMTWGGASSTAVLLVITLASGESLWAATLHGWLILAGLALISQVAGQGLIAYALAHLSAAFGSVGLLLQPVLASIFAWVLLHENLGMLQLAGGVIVLYGVYLARISHRLS